MSRFLLVAVLTLFVTTVFLTVFGARVAFGGLSPWALVWVFLAGALLAAFALARDRMRT